MPFFSPDGEWIGFFAGGHLKKVAAGGGSAHILAPVGNPTGGTWMDDGSIVFIGGMGAGVQRVPSSGGPVEVVMRLSGEMGAASSPWALPGSRAVLLMVRHQARFDIAVLSLEVRRPSGRHTIPWLSPSLVIRSVVPRCRRAIRRRARRIRRLRPHGFRQDTSSSRRCRSMRRRSRQRDVRFPWRRVSEPGSAFKAGSSTEILSLPADGAGEVERIATFGADSGAVPTSATSDVLLVQDRFSRDTGMDIVAVSLTDRKLMALIATPSDEAGGVLSPDGRLVAYVSNESGRNEVYLRPYAGEGPRVVVSSGGGFEPVWSTSGDELFFRNGADLLSVAVANGKPTRPRVLFSRADAFGAVGTLVAAYDVGPRGKNFVAMAGRQWKHNELVVFTNWFADLRKAEGSAPVRGAH